jgi:nucleoside phosphorylase
VTTAATTTMTATETTAIVAALPTELAGVVRASFGRRRAGSRWVRATLAGEPVVMAATGDGALAAAAGVEALLAAVRPRRLLVLGVAGGLTPGLARGTLVAAQQVVAEDGTPASQAPDAAWLAQALAAGAVGGVAVTGSSIVGDPAARRRLLERAMGAAAERARETGGGPAATIAAGAAEAAAAARETGGALGATMAAGAAIAAEAEWSAATVDLESLAYARGAAAHGVPYLVVRAVLDPAEETLPLDFEACRTAGGRVSSVRVVLRALARPSSFGALWRLRGRVAAEAARLAALAQRLMQEPGAAGEAATAAGRGGADTAAAARGGGEKAGAGMSDEAAAESAAVAAMALR